MKQSLFHVRQDFTFCVGISCRDFTFRVGISLFVSGFHFSCQDFTFRVGISLFVLGFHSSCRDFTLCVGILNIKFALLGFHRVINFSPLKLDIAPKEAEAVKRELAVEGVSLQCMQSRIEGVWNAIIDIASLQQTVPNMPASVSFN